MSEKINYEVIRKNQQEILLCNLLLIKSSINKIDSKLEKPNGISQKNRISLMDKKNKLRRDFATLFYDNKELITKLIEDITRENKNAFCIMAMVGGPVFVAPHCKLSVYDFGFAQVRVVFDGWIGSIDFISKRCGVDNLKAMSDFLLQKRLPSLFLEAKSAI